MANWWRADAKPHYRTLEPISGGSSALGLVLLYPPLLYLKIIYNMHIKCPEYGHKIELWTRCLWANIPFFVVTELPQFWQWDGGSLRLNRGWEGRGITHHAMPWAERDHPPPLNHSHGVSSPPCCQSIDSRHKVSNEKEIETNFLAMLLDIWAHTVMTIYNTLPESEQNWMKEKVEHNPVLILVFP